MICHWAQKLLVWVSQHGKLINFTWFIQTHEKNSATIWWKIKMTGNCVEAILIRIGSCAIVILVSNMMLHLEKLCTHMKQVILKPNNFSSTHQQILMWHFIVRKLYHNLVIYFLWIWSVYFFSNSVFLL